MGSLCVVREFVDNLQSVVQLPKNSSSCGWKSKDLAVAQSQEASLQGRICLPSSNVLIYMSPIEGVAQIKGCRSPAEGVAQIKGVCIHAFNHR